MEARYEFILPPAVVACQDNELLECGIRLGAAMIAQSELIKLFAEGMEQHGHAALIRGDRLEHRDSGITIHPRAYESRPSPDLVHSVVVVTLNHPRFPEDGIFEYQHAVAETQREGICDGLDQWLQMDFTVLLDALRDRPQTCSAMEWRFDTSPGQVRRVLFGPIGHMVTQPERIPKDAEHPFCPCCLFTNTYEIFLPQMKTDGFYGIRQLASRDENGSIQADCRINGSEFETGKRALRAYAETWPQAGIEMRKQYIVMQSLTDPSR